MAKLISNLIAPAIFLIRSLYRKVTEGVLSKTELKQKSNNGNATAIFNISNMQRKCLHINMQPKFSRKSSVTHKILCIKKFIKKNTQRQWQHSTIYNFRYVQSIKMVIYEIRNIPL